MALSEFDFSSCLSDGWLVSIGDPTVSGWAICAAYAGAAILAARVWNRSPFSPTHRGREKLLWLLIAGLMAAMALNKQLDLQTLLVTGGRCLAKEQGWYADRRLVQREFIFALITALVVLGAGLIWLLRGIVRHNLKALLGLAALGTFVVIRGGHLFHLFVPDQERADYLVHLLALGLEALSPALIILATWGALRKPGIASTAVSRTL